MAIEAVIWDFGGVFTTSPFEAFRRFEAQAGLPQDFIRRVNAADPDTNASPAFLRIGAAAETSWLPAGPITPTMLEFDANDCDTVEASDGVSCVSPWTMLIFTACVLFHSATQSLCSATNCSKFGTHTFTLSGSNPFG